MPRTLGSSSLPPSQAKWLASGDQIEQKVLTAGYPCEASTRELCVSGVMITVLPVQGGGHATPKPETTATSLPSGDQRGSSAVKPARSSCMSLPSAFIV